MTQKNILLFFTFFAISNFLHLNIIASDGPERKKDMSDDNKQIIVQHTFATAKQYPHIESQSQVALKIASTCKKFHGEPADRQKLISNYMHNIPFFKEKFDGFFELERYIHFLSNETVPTPQDLSNYIFDNNNIAHINSTLELPETAHEVNSFRIANILSEEVQKINQSLDVIQSFDCYCEPKSSFMCKGLHWGSHSKHPLSYLYFKFHFPPTALSKNIDQRIKNKKNNTSNNKSNSSYPKKISLSDILN